MSFRDRDYYRDGGDGDNWLFHAAPGVKYLIVVNAIVFLLQIFIVRDARPEEFAKIMPGLLDVDDDAFDKAFNDAKNAQDAQDANDVPDDKGRKNVKRPDPKEMKKHLNDMKRLLGNMPGMRISVVQDWLALDTNKVIYRGQIWRLLTYSFCHDRFGLLHIVINMLILWWFGHRLELMYGTREFVLFYLAAAVVSGIAYVALDVYLEMPGVAVGASGSVMAVFTVYALHFPYETIYVFYILPLQLRFALLLYVLFDLHPVLLALSGDGMFTGIAHAAHLGGAAFGFAYLKLGWRLEPLVDRLQIFGQSRWSRARRLRVVRPSWDDDDPIDAVIPIRRPARERPDADERVDEVLRKITESGKESLTPEEWEVLERASGEYRKRDE